MSGTGSSTVFKKSVSIGNKGWWIGVATLFFLSALLFTYNVRLLVLSRSEVHPALNMLFPAEHSDRNNVWKDETSKAMHSLMACIATSSCGENQTSVVLLASPHFAMSIEGSVGGEDIWAASVLSALRNMGYTFLYSTDIFAAAEQYRTMPDLVRVVIAEASAVQRCHESANCVKRADNILGIPVWKMFSFHFWAGPEHPLGGTWTLSPEDYRNGNQYIGYSVEESCTARQVAQSSQRRAQVYVLGKRLAYYYHQDYSWSDDIYVRLHEDLELNLAAGIYNDTDFESAYPPYIENQGVLSQQEFYDVVGQSQVLLGIGIPPLSPSPYDGLCLGVPYINPILDWDNNNPEDRTAWRMQHESLKWLDPPYVYNVQRHNSDALVEAIRSAQANPIQSFIPPAMRRAALQGRVAYLVENDWRTAAEVILAQRIATGNEPLFDI